jgi:hypothetical protein
MNLQIPTQTSVFKSPFERAIKRLFKIVPYDFVRSGLIHCAAQWIPEGRVIGVSFILVTFL